VGFRLRENLPLVASTQQASLPSLLQACGRALTLAVKAYHRGKPLGEKLQVALHEPDGNRIGD
jgi:hypothetical protein